MLGGLESTWNHQTAHCLLQRTGATPFCDLLPNTGMFQKEKVYVQQRLWENQEAVWKLIQDGGHIYVCGDAQYMAPDVEACLLKILREHGDLNEVKAQAFLDSLAQAGRYQRDVWF